MKNAEETFKQYKELKTLDTFEKAYLFVNQYENLKSEQLKIERATFLVQLVSLLEEVEYSLSA